MKDLAEKSDAPDWTPGPWIPKDTVKGNYEFSIHCSDATGSIVAQVGGFPYAPRSLKETAANARLIAAAPELYAAMESIVERSPEPYLPGDDVLAGMDRVRARFDAARAALKKARG